MTMIQHRERTKTRSRIVEPQRVDIQDLAEVMALTSARGESVGEPSENPRDLSFKSSGLAHDYPVITRARRPPRRSTLSSFLVNLSAASPPKALPFPARISETRRGEGTLRDGGRRRLFEKTLVSGIAQPIVQ